MARSHPIPPPVATAPVSAAPAPVPPRRTPRLPLTHALMRWALVTVFSVVGIAKLVGAPPTVELFDAVGVGQWFRYVVGCCEIVGAALLAYPPTALNAARALGLLMTGAVGTELFILHRAPLSSAPVLAAIALLLSTWRRPA